ncbi:MAG: hypothetical protein U1E27_03785 [Kiritimatiellia bacterium]|nr:hypothetical protein [Kiritimatiellia bacterium]
MMEEWKLETGRRRGSRKGAMPGTLKMAKKGTENTKGKPERVPEEICFGLYNSAAAGDHLSRRHGDHGDVLDPFSIRSKKRATLKNMWKTLGRPPLPTQ